MKVLIIHTTYKYKGGEGTVVDEEMELLKSNGIEVELLQFYNAKSTLAKVVQMPFNLQSYRRTRRKLKTFKADIVHIHNLHFAASASVIYALKKSKIPFVMTLHNYRLLCPSATLFFKGELFLNSTRQAFPWKAIAQGVYKDSKLLTLWLALSMKLHQWMGTWQACSRYIVLSQHTKKIFAESGWDVSNNRFIVKPNFCIVPPLMPLKRSDYFLYVGRLIEEKGVRLLLRLFSSCGYKIKIAGDGPLRKEVIQYSTQYTNIEYLGILKKDEVFELMSTCTALLFPSTWFEGMPLTIIEAFSCGTPVIASKLGAMESMITHHYNGLHFEPGSEQQLAACMDEWQRLTKEQQDVYRTNARQTYEEIYTPEKNFSQLMAIYTSVLNKQQSVEVTKAIKKPALLKTSN